MKNSKYGKLFVNLALLFLFIFFLWLIINGHKSINFFGLVQQLVGLSGLIAMLYGYNRAWTK